ncbi:ankyrin repeat family protein [Stylonychia lemnae]|uniref:phosphopyruvate hydratase n=1 Tax=Stylonychia lemnae TaxID=5949 RepID=A0A078A993_STYLE|nr:ankyrin repeat family protein [Stylonychia lemnae]|eukprot:CDW78142.1 ankyrin repeat family protein [Stylonychia lemnae]
MNELNRKESTKSLPEQVGEYISHHNIDKIVNRALNHVLRTKPIDPLSAIATILLSEAKNSLPVFDRIYARKTFLYETSTNQTLKLQVYLNFQGRSDIRYTHILAYDPEEQDKFLFDNKAEKTGLEHACDIINNEISQHLHGKVIETMDEIDQQLHYFYQGKMDGHSDIGFNVIKACSEAILFAAASCFERINLYKSIRVNQYQSEFPAVHTKLMLTLFNGGKSNGSAVKFQKFYLIIDPYDRNENHIQTVDIVDSYLKFQQALRKAVSTTKQGEAGFKPGPDSSYFNALGSINETFKIIEDSITTSGANTADGKVFKIGINCEADSYFNKDPKDANKYEVEGQKNQADQDQLTEYYAKVCNEHPLVAYIEDPFANHDVKGYQKITAKFKSALPHVKVGVKAMFNDGAIQKIDQMTVYNMVPGPNNEMIEDADTNKDKFTPHLIHLNRQHLKTISEHALYHRNLISQPKERQYNYVIDDGKIESLQTGIVDFAIGFGFEYLNIQGFIKAEKVAKSGDFPKFESQLAKTLAPELVAPIQDGRNLLHIICASGYTKYAQLLLNSATQKQILSELLDSKEEKEGQTPLFFAIRCAPNGFPEIIQLLIKSGCNVNLRDKLGRAAIHFACEQGQDDTLQLLIQHGADCNVQDIDDLKTPLHFAIQNGQYNAVQILCEQGNAKKELVDKNGDSVLHYAAIGQGNANLYLRYLIEKQGMSVFIKNAEKLTPKELAEKLSKQKYHRVIKNLKNYEAKETVKINAQKQSKVKKIKKIVIYEDEKGIVPLLMKNIWVSALAPVILALLLLFIEKLLF